MGTGEGLTESLFQFMPYGAPELKEVARKYMFRGVMAGSIAWLLIFLLSLGGGMLMKLRPHETKVIVVPYRELAAPPPLLSSPARLPLPASSPSRPANTCRSIPAATASPTS